MGILSWIIVGAIAGWLSGQFMKGRGFGLLGNILVGVAGGLVGGYLAGVLFKIPNTMDGINVTAIVIAFLGAVLLIFIARAFQGRSGGGLIHR